MKPLRVILLVISIVLAAGAIIAGILFSQPQDRMQPPADIDATSDTNTQDDTTEKDIVISQHPDHPVIYVSFVTHNEDTFSPNYPNFPQDEEAFWDFRSRVINYANMLYEMGVKYNYQSDWTFLLGIKAFDKGTQDTNGKNLLAYLEQDLGFSIDPHSHEQGGYNYADVAYLMELLGVHPTGIVGGFTAQSTGLSEDPEWEKFWKPIAGQMFDYLWTPTILWGGAVPGHRAESDVWISGIWRPSTYEEGYTTHDPDAPLPNVGGFGRDWDNLDLQIERLQAGELNADQMYTQTILVGEHQITDELIEEYRDKIASYDQLVEDGYIQWVTLQEAVEIWKTQYDSYGGIMLYDGTELKP